MILKFSDSLQDMDGSERIRNSWARHVEIIFSTKSYVNDRGG